MVKINLVGNISPTFNHLQQPATSAPKTPPAAATSVIPPVIAAPASAVGYFLPPAFFVETFNPEAWANHPTLTTAMTAFALNGTASMVAAAAELSGLAAYVDKTRLSSVARGMDRARLYFQDAMAAITILAAGTSVFVSGWNGNLLRSLLFFLIPFVALFIRPLNKIIWPRHEKTKAIGKALEAISRDPQNNYYKKTKKTARSIFPSKPVPFPYAPKIIRSIVDISYKSPFLGRTTLEIDYSECPMPKRRGPNVLHDVALTASYGIGGIPVAVKRPTLDGIVALASQWADELLKANGIRRIIHIGIENIPKQPIAVANLTHWDFKDIPVQVASGRHVGLYFSQLGKKALRRIPGLKEAEKVGLLNPTGAGFEERTEEHVTRKDLPAGIFPANLTYTAGHRTNREMTVSLADLANAHGIAPDEKSIREIFGKVETDPAIGKNEEGVLMVTWTPSDREIFLPHTGICRQAVGVGTPIVPVVHRYIQNEDGTQDVEITWYPAIPVKKVGRKKGNDHTEEVRRVHDLLLETIEKEIIGKSDRLALFHKIKYVKKRKGVISEILGMARGKKG